MIRTKTLALSAALLAACSQPATQTAATAAGPPVGCVTGIGSLGGPIDLIDQSGAAVTQAAYAGKPALLYFGFTNCPDVCPIALDLLGQTLAGMGAEADDLQPILITVDPARDTPEKLAQYVATDRFPPHLVGLTGPVDRIDATALAYGVGATRDGTGDATVVGHASNVYVMDAQWRLRAFMPTNEATPDTLAQCIATALADE